MTKKQILELTGLSESEFYKKYPTKESFEKDAENYKKGGIYIKPENRGKFTATKKRTGKTTEELTHSKNPLTRKRAIFAQNAKKWKHAEGGSINPELLKNISGSLSQLGNMKMGQSQAGQPPQQGNTGKTIGSVIGGIAGSFIPIPGVGTMLGSTVGGMLGGIADKKSYENKATDYDMNNLNKAQGGFKKGGELIKRADGSYSRRGLWDNIRANRGSGKTPTKAMLEQESKIKAKMAKGGKLEHLGDNLYKVKSYIKGTDKVEVRPNVFFDNKEVVRKNRDGSMQILSDDLGYAKPVEKVAKAMGGKAAQSLFNTMYTKQEMSKTRRPVDKFTDNANERKNYVKGGPFSKQEEGDAFRQWVNKKYPEYAKKINLDPSGSFNNPYIKKAYKEYGDEYNMRFELPSMDDQEQQAQKSDEPGIIDQEIYGRFKGNPKQEWKKTKNQQPIPNIPYTKDKEVTDLKPVDEFLNSKNFNEYPFKMSSPELSPQSNEYQMKQISPWWLAASGASDIANLLMSRPDDVNLERYKPTLVDPYRANKLLASELRKQANAASSAIRGTANTQGTYLASEIANRSRLNEAIGSQLAQSNLQSLLSNTDLINKAKLANVDISTMEKDLRQREKDASRSIRSQALSQMGSNIMQYGRDRKQVDQTNAMLPYIAGENYYFKDENGKPVIMRKYNPFEEGSTFSPFFTKEKAGKKPTGNRFGGKIKKK